ncbi:MAG TPA: histidine--tRNA ligase [Candidatus Cloacimonadota bacterium]|nr:histidine--tRNA ligase [Candidatus Cloacimonadota bacterium]
MQYKIPRGTFDILPEESYRWQKVKQLFCETAQAFGYAEIETPIFEQAELFERSSGVGSDIVQKEMYRFQDRKGRNLALRPEGTAPVVRSFVENHWDKTSRLTKLYYLGPMFRYDRPQAGRYRQFYQYGAECLGSHHPYYDAEIIELEDTFLRKLGLKQIRLELNSVGCPVCGQDYDAALVEYFTPHKDELCPDCQVRLQMKPRRILDCKVPSCRALIENAPVMTDYLDQSCREHFEQVQKYLTEMEIPFTLNPHIVRGLDYYTQTAFEFLNPVLGAQNAVSGGGRYDGLVEQIGGKPTPAVGIAGGFERLLLSLEKEGITISEPEKPFAALILSGEKAKTEGIYLLAKLRRSGLFVIYDPERETLSAQLKAAANQQAKFALIIGDDEVKSGKVTVKDLQTGKQQFCPKEELEILLKILRTSGDNLR